MRSELFLIREAVRLVKEAKLKPGVDLQPQQRRVIERIKQEPGVLVYHGLGSGKTLSSIAAAEELGGKKSIVVPASLRENYKKELKKWVKSPKGYNVISYNKASDPSSLPESDVSIIDEGHRIGRSDSALSEIPDRLSGKKLVLTGTPIRNEPSELLPLMRAVASDRPIPTSADDFNSQFIAEKKVYPSIIARLRGVKPGIEKNLKNADRLKRMLRGRVDYHASSGDFPDVKEEEIDVQMDPEQQTLYDRLMGSNPALAYKVRRNLPPNKRELSNLNSFLTAVRQVSNNPAAYNTSLTGDSLQYSSKLRRMLDEIKARAVDPKHKTLVYSNFLDAGVKPLSEALNREQISSGVFYGGLGDKERKKLIDDYNKNKLKVLLVSGAGSEGLDLKGTRLVQLMEPYWNEARSSQVIGRAVRNKSHSHLKPKDRNVTVQRFYSSPVPSFLERYGLRKQKNIGADRYMKRLSSDKQRLNEQLLEVLRQVGSEPVFANRS